MSKQYRATLYLDTAGEFAQAAIYIEGRCVQEASWKAGYDLSGSLSEKIKALLQQSKISVNDLDSLCVFSGPGSFTGLRIGISFMNGLAFSLGIPIFETDERGKLKMDHVTDIIIPKYGAEPNITKPKATR